MQSNPDLEKRIASRIGISRPKSQSFMKMFLAPSFAFAALICFLSVSTLSANAEQGIGSVFLNYGGITLPDSQVSTLAMIAILSALWVLGVSTWSVVRYAKNTVLKSLFIVSALLVILIPTSIALLSRSNHTISGSVSQIHCDENAVTLKNDTEERLAYFPADGNDIAMNIYRKNGDSLGSWTKSTFCHPGANTPLLEAISEIQFTLTVNWFDTIKDWRADQAIPSLGSVIREGDITITSILWSDSDVGGSGKVSIVVEKNDTTTAELSIDNQFVFPELERVTDTDIIVALKTETRCITTVYAINRESGTVKTIQDQGCFIESLDDGTLFFETTDEVKVFKDGDVTPAFRKAENTPQVFLGKASPDSNAVVFILWEGIYGGAHGELVYYDVAQHASRVLSKELWNTVEWSTDSQSISVHTENGDQVFNVEIES